MNLEDLTIGDARKLVKLFSVETKTHSFSVGQAYFVRTVTYHCLGRLKSVTDTDLVFDNASWVASSGRWNNALKTGELDEVEPHVSDLIVSRSAIVDAQVWLHALPAEVK